ncbi:universal stress protein [Algibacter sp. L4_22]|uniref:universal stress protein n=1 Tax=Algibacter sp. L4_22 TaxID=2942477 RepID=UPI00201B5247|nr:universal stress protein [Algibacter sp. L4_22]MCL5128264.1 universal stress protein [Algibacter sp. L4_22]
MKRKILLPTDFSDNAWSATVYALKLFAEQECTFYFLNSIVVKVNMLSNVSNKLITTMRENAMVELLDLKELVQSSDPNPKHDFDIILSSDDLNKAVKNAVEKHDISLIIMGTKGATGAKELFFGSNTVSLIMKIKNCPVLMIPEEFDFIKPKQIAFPTDYNHFYHANEIKSLRELADLYSSEIRIVHIDVEEELSDKQSDNLIVLESYLKNNNFSLHWMPNYAEKVEEINDFIEELDIDILAMVKHNHNFFQKILNEPVIKDLGFHAKIPFLVIPESVDI